MAALLSACGSDGGSTTVSKPAAPSNLTASVSGDSVSLSWDYVSAATSYRVYRGGEAVETISANSFSENGLADGTYFYEVSSVNDVGESASKASVYVEVDTTAPDAPAELTATADGSSVSLAWSLMSRASSYKVYRDGSLLGSVNTNSFSENGLADGTYFYEVSSVNGFGESEDKASVNVNVNTSRPVAPNNLTASVSGSIVSLTWDLVGGAISYEVYRDGVLLDSVNTNSFSESGLSSGSYLYEVSSVNEFGESEDKAEVVVIITEPLYIYQWHLENTGQSAFASNSGTSGEDINHSAALALGVTGEGIRVNVIDKGLELQHPDLQANILAGGSYDYVGGDDDPTNNYESDGDHGTSVAGLIAAVGDNDLGGSGVAPDAWLQGYNWLLSSKTTADYILAHGLDDKLSNTDIFNKSLGASNTNDAHIDSDLLDTLSCLTTGGSFDMGTGSSCSSALRSGSGAIYVKSAGNDFNTESGLADCDALGVTCWNTNMEPEHTYPYQIVVGALNARGKKSSYSTAGSAIWISAPGGEYGRDYSYIDSELSEYGESYTPSNTDDPMWQPAMITTDQAGCDRGYTTRTFTSSGIAVGRTSFHSNGSLNGNCEYTSTFNGTSSAAPVLSGVIALMLEANPDLSWRDVKHILANSARQVDSNLAALEVPATACVSDDYGYSCPTHEFSSYITLTVRDAWITNAAGYKYHNWYGFGAVNAGAAVAMAQSYSSPLGAWNKNSYSQSISASIPDATGDAATIDITVSGDLTIEAIQLDLSITHAEIGYLAIVLYSPSLTRSVLLTPYNQYGFDDNFSSTLLSNAFYGENSNGNWTLEVYDMYEYYENYENISGTLDGVTLSIYGH